MIKISATKSGGGKVLILGVTRRNVELLMIGRPIKIIGSEVGCDHDIHIFFGETEQAMVDMLLGEGVELPKVVKPHHDDDRQEGGGKI